MTSMTEAQQEAFSQISRIMSEHFDSAVCIVCYEGHNGEQSTDSIKVVHSGGFAAVVGLCELGKSWLTYKASEPSC